MFENARHVPGVFCFAPDKVKEKALYRLSNDTNRSGFCRHNARIFLF